MKDTLASEFRSKNTNLRTGFMSLLLSLIETLRQSPHERHKADLAVAYAALGSMTEAGFKLDCLEKKLDEMSEKKEKEEAGETRMQEIENELKDLKLKCSDLEAELKKEKLEVLAAKELISLDTLFSLEFLGAWVFVLWCSDVLVCSFVLGVLVLVLVLGVVRLIFLNLKLEFGFTFFMCSGRFVFRFPNECHLRSASRDLGPISNC